uniref:Uncharacterized protein n=1 Tax=Paenibacillus athensensis TaxID=1967502 RepID=A0A4Y8PXC5_9BACL
MTVLKIFLLFGDEKKPRRRAAQGLQRLREPHGARGCGGVAAGSGRGLAGRANAGRAGRPEGDASAAMRDGAARGRARRWRAGPAGWLRGRAATADGLSAR